jgi:hypothetical protein
METSTIIAIVGAILLGYGYMKYTERKKDVGKFSMGIGAVLLILVFTGLGGFFQPLAVSDIAGPTTPSDLISQQACELKPYMKLAVTTKVYSSNSYTAASGTVKVYEDGVDPTSPNSNPKDTVTIASGTGNTTNSSLTSCTNYSVVFDGGSTYYDMWFGSGAQPLPYVVTDESAISLATINFDNVLTVATIDDPIDESATDGVINGQTSALATCTTYNSTTSTCEAYSSSEITVGDATDQTATDDEDLYYNVTNGDGQFYLDLAIGFSGGDKVVKDPALCFVNDLSNPFEGNEFRSVTAQRRTGTDFGIPSDITNYVNQADCISLGSQIDGGTSGTYRLTFNVDESLLTAGGDIMYVYIDDLGEYLGQDTLRGTKATASDAITLQIGA